MKKELLVGLLIALVIGVFLSPFASKAPDGLDKTAESLKFASISEGKEVIRSLIPDYAMPGVKNESLATSAAGFVGSLVVFGLAYGVGKIMQGKKQKESL